MKKSHTTKKPPKMAAFQNCLELLMIDGKVLEGRLPFSRD